jgi:hypothetical protein
LKIHIEKPVNLKTIVVSAKVDDHGTYDFLDENDKHVYEHNGYVPRFFPGTHYGGYFILHIDIETGTILNWDASRIRIQEWFDERNEE